MKKRKKTKSKKPTLKSRTAFYKKQGHTNPSRSARQYMEGFNEFPKVRLGKGFPTLAYMYGYNYAKKYKK